MPDLGNCSNLDGDGSMGEVTYCPNCDYAVADEFIITNNLGTQFLCPRCKQVPVYNFDTKSDPERTKRHYSQPGMIARRPGYQKPSNDDWWIASGAPMYQKNNIVDPEHKP